jgi:hypothetical protein
MALADDDRVMEVHSERTTDSGGSGCSAQGYAAANSDLMRGKIGRFSLDVLVVMLSDPGLEVNMQLNVAGWLSLFPPVAH